MATKAKTELDPKSIPASTGQGAPLAESFSQAVKLVDSGKYADAVKKLESLMQEAQAAGDWPMKRRAQVYLALADSKVHPHQVAVTDPVSEIQACLNRRATAEALDLVEKALKAAPSKGTLHYLRAVAFAQNDNVEASAECLKKALELNGDLVFQWHMEPDFNPIRKSPLFGFTEGR
ncbi:hypothetical protein [Geothrix sp. 21YS21S-4]|uniref:TPR end-of-group domain-containing protein n=1 Tax=Geothrix sp. 21YS21S-4 TaxID=3068889 RepID=UPI0027BB1124|nr:hypothetical protein [Geothrix sp. 21YS21S-4]